MVYYARMSEEIQALVAKAKQGNKDAFGDLYRMYVRKIYRFVYFLLQNHYTAEDITQETFLRAWRALPNFSTKQEGTFQAFLFAIARNLVTDFRRKKPTVLLSDSNDPGVFDDIEEKLFHLQRGERVREILQRLAPFEQHIIALRFFEELSFAEIARVVGTTEGAVRVRLHRVLKILKTYLEGKI